MVLFKDNNCVLFEQKQSTAYMISISDLKVEIENGKLKKKTIKQ